MDCIYSATVERDEEGFFIDFPAFSSVAFADGGTIVIDLAAPWSSSKRRASTRACAAETNPAREKRRGTALKTDDPNIARPNADGVTVLPAEWYCPEDEGLYDDLVSEFGLDGD